MRAFAASVQGSVALDFRYGLDRLAALVEPADAHEGPIGALGAAIDRVVGERRTALTRQGVTATGEPIGVYVKTDVKRRTTRCRFGLPIGAAEIKGLDLATLPAHRAFTARREATGRDSRSRGTLR